MTSTLSFTEEPFGILTDDNLYLDCVLIKPVGVEDEAFRAIRVWVPKFPLTKSSVITCARQEVKSHGSKRKVAHLVFDLRGTGDSEGTMGDHDFKADLHAVAEWAKERFGRINFGFLGTPESENGRVNLWPLRAGSVMESYHYPAAGNLMPSTVLYLSTYGNFSRTDDALCSQLAKAGYHVYGLDPLRYLLHASTNHRLNPDDLAADLQILIQMLPSKPIIVAQPLAAGLGLLWASRVNKVAGVIAVGRAQAGLSPSHIFHNSNPYTYLLHRHVPDISPRPMALVMLKGNALGGDEDEMATLMQSSNLPNRLERVDRLAPKLLLELLTWTQRP
ncbi:hypothetical protein MNBD_CHLOROFLEXI01-1117 [hydrothermal vent metagenome]|uniref:AB hydrolase-1 domain-containing protein n=1 Tax=hydrothermal vent metagenome TaxID=652676 RepID=A0A3B0UI79_9ZZZZ